MDKKKQKDNNWIGIGLVITTILIVGIVLYQTTPTKHCHKETKTEKMELKAYCMKLSSGYILDCIKDSYYASDDEIILCEEGVEYYELLERYTNYDEEPKICLIKRIEEVCEIK